MLPVVPYLLLLLFNIILYLVKVLRFPEIKWFFANFLVFQAKNPTFRVDLVFLREKTGATAGNLSV